MKSNDNCVQITHESLQYGDLVKSEDYTFVLPDDMVVAPNDLVVYINCYGYGIGRVVSTSFEVDSSGRKPVLFKLSDNMNDTITNALQEYADKENALNEF